MEQLITSSCPWLVGGINSDTFSLSNTRTKTAHEARERLQAESARFYIISQMLLV